MFCSSKFFKMFIYADLLLPKLNISFWFRGGVSLSYQDISQINAIIYLLGIRIDHLYKPVYVIKYLIKFIHFWLDLEINTTKVAHKIWNQYVVLRFSLACKLELFRLLPTLPSATVTNVISLAVSWCLQCFNVRLDRP